MKRVRKVLTYITYNNQLLVFRHRDFPEAGIQVPAGTVEDQENLESAALREAAEETGLRNLKVIKYLGTLDWDASQFRPEIHERHFFHVEAQPPLPDEWLHYEMTPAGGGAPIAYKFFWTNIQRTALFADQGSLLDKIHDNG